MFMRSGINYETKLGLLTVSIEATVKIIAMQCGAHLESCDVDSGAEFIFLPDGKRILRSLSPSMELILRYSKALDEFEAKIDAEGGRLCRQTLPSCEPGEPVLITQEWRIICL